MFDIKEVSYLEDIETRQCICCGRVKVITSFEKTNHGKSRSTRCNVCKKHKHRINRISKIPADERTKTQQRQLRVSEVYMYKCNLVTGYL